MKGYSLTNTTIFLSTSTAEFGSYRVPLSTELDRPNCSVKVQENFIAGVDTTLDKLDDYILKCNAVIHLVGDMTGAMAKAQSVEAIVTRYQDLEAKFPLLAPYLQPGGPCLSYTQWEAWLALYHHKPLIIAVPAEGAPRSDGYAPTSEGRDSQALHLKLLSEYEKYPEITFNSVERLALELYKSQLNDILPPPAIASATLTRLRQLASSLINMARIHWNTPQFIAPLKLSVIKSPEKDKVKYIREKEVKQYIDHKRSLVLFGDGGIGKTTLLLSLVENLIQDDKSSIPLYLDAASWARNQLDFFEYIASAPCAVKIGMTAVQLMQAASAGHIALIINGWNEIPTVQKFTCLTNLKQILATYPSLNIVLTTRSEGDHPSLDDPIRIEVKGLSWEEQINVIHSQLKDNSAQLIHLLSVDNELRYSARNPLILMGLIAKARKFDLASVCTFDLLGAVINEFEEEEQRNASLHEAPLLGFQKNYLQALAVHLTNASSIAMSREELLPVIARTARQLSEQGLIGSAFQPTEILEFLSARHLLHGDAQTFRFSHQRLQEYYSANWLHNLVVSSTKENLTLLKEAINQPFWQDAMFILAGKIYKTKAYKQARINLVKAAFEIDIGIACELIGDLEFTEADDAELFGNIVKLVEALYGSPHKVIADYAVRCMLASESKYFAEHILSLVEVDDLQDRLHLFRLYGGGLSVRQLEGHAERVSKWPTERQVEFIRELGDNSKNYDYLVAQLNSEIENEVRKAAIQALLWTYPASEEPLNAWFNSDIEIQTDPSVLNLVGYVIEQGGGTEVLRNQYLSIISQAMTFNDVRIVLNEFSEKIDEDILDNILIYLRELDYRQDDKEAIDFVQKRNPEKLQELAKEIFLSKRSVPKWVAEHLRVSSEEFRVSCFEEAWSLFIEVDSNQFCSKSLGSIANEEQIIRCIELRIEYGKRYRELTEPQKSLHRNIVNLICSASGDVLLNAIIKCVDNSDYSKTCLLTDFFYRRISNEKKFILDDEDGWLPTVVQVEELISAFGSIKEVGEILQGELNVNLSRIASAVDPSHFSKFILNTLQEHLESWSTYRSVIAAWIKNPIQPRPNNPMQGNMLSSAFEAWGFDAIDSLLGYLEHEESGELIPSVLNRILQVPWRDTHDNKLGYVFIDYFVEGENRRKAGRVLRQPDNTYQEITDRVAKALGENVINLVNHLNKEKQESGDEFNLVSASYRQSNLVSIFVNIPSPDISNYLDYAVANGFFDIYKFDDLLKGLIRQGVLINNPKILKRIETILDEETSAKWIENGKRSVLSRWCQILLSVESEANLEKSFDYYFELWFRVETIDGIISSLGKIPSNRSFYRLLDLAKNRLGGQRLPDHFSESLFSVINADNINEFIFLIESGEIFNWANSDYRLQNHLSPYIAPVIIGNPEGIDKFFAACAASGNPLAESLVLGALSKIPDSDEFKIDYLISAIKSGKFNGERGPLVEMLSSLIHQKETLGDENHYVIYPVSSNGIRAQIYQLARNDDSVGLVCRKILATIENWRNKSGRPSDESRHPDISDGMMWANVLKIGE